MERNYNVSGEQRKELVKAVSEAVRIEPVYKGAPTFAYAVGNFTISKDGRLSWDDRVSDEEAAKVVEAVEAAGFTAEETEEANETTVDEAAEGTEQEEDATEETIEADEEEAAGATETDEPDATELTVEMPRSFYTGQALENLQKIVDSKAGLIKKAVGSDELAINIGDEKVAFPWFRTRNADEARAYTEFISRISAMAKDAKRVTAKEKEVESEAYAFRCFLLRLGMSGSEHKAARRVLMRNLDGPSAFPTKAAADAFAAKQKEKRDAAKAGTAAGEES